MKKTLRGIIIFTCMIVLMSFVASGLVRGGRWSSGLLLGGIDNWLYNGGTLYTNAEKGMTPGSSYFPGVMFVAALLRLLLGYRAETAFIVCGGLVTILTFLAFSKIASDDKEKQFTLFVMGICLFFMEFPSARIYLLELHPDIPALMCFAWGIILMNRFLENHGSIDYVKCTILFYCAGLFKQNAVFLYFGLGIYALLSPTYKWKAKVLILLSELMAGIATLITVISIKGCWYNCITVNSLHPLQTKREYISYAVKTCLNNKFFIIVACVSCILLLLKRITLKREIEKMWLASAIGWFGFGMFGAAKQGANTGNMEAAIIAFMPLVLCFIEKFYKYIKGILHREKYDGIFADNVFRKKMKFVSLCGSIILCLLINVVAIKSTITCLWKYNERLAAESEFSKWISECYPECNVAYNTITYELLNHATVNKTTDLYTVSVWEMGKLIEDDDLKRIAEEEKWDVIITWPGLNDTKWPKTFEDFKKLEIEKYPNLKDYYGENVEVFARYEKMD